MGNPMFLLRKNQNFLWKCRDCDNVEEFEEDWHIEIIQDFNHMNQEYYLVESENIRCKKCSSYKIEEVEASS
jgi:hypothetical protein